MTHGWDDEDYRKACCGDNQRRSRKESEMDGTSVDDTVMPAVGERWRHCKTNQVARVMAVAEKWIMARYKGAMPWVRHWNDFRGEYVRVGQ